MNKLTEYAGYGAFAMALTATVGSLMLSEAFGLVPCVLCWYQRILMYPLVVIIGVAISRKDRSWPFTVLPLAVLGWAIALYHSLLQWSIIPESAAPCVAGISCTTKEISLLGFITIPFMAFAAFTVIILTSVVFLKGVYRDKRS